MKNASKATPWKKGERPVVALDLELNQPSGKIIEIGVVVGMVSSGQILGVFEILVNPEEPLCRLDPVDIVDLTAITEELIADHGVSLPEAYAALQTFLNMFQAELNPLTWGGGDSESLRLELGVTSVDPKQGWPFGRRWTDVKTVYQAFKRAQGMGIQGGLKTAIKDQGLGLSFQGRPHRAACDAFNTLRIYRALLAQFKNHSIAVDETSGLIVEAAVPKTLLKSRSHVDWNEYAKCVEPDKTASPT